MKWKKWISACLALGLTVSAFAAAMPRAAAADAKTEPGLWLTEIYQNDRNRSGVFSNSSDQMEFVEVTNTAGEAVSLGTDYTLWYEYPSGDTMVMKQLTISSPTGSTVVEAGETVVLWSQRTDLGGEEGVSYASEAQFRQAMQMAASTQQESDGLQEGVDDASMEAEKLIEAPDLSVLIGMTQDQAIEAVGRGATVTATQAVNEEGNPIRSTATIALTDEPADTRSGTPTVYLGFDEGGAIIQAGYSAPTSSLGYGSLSFADAVSNEHVVEQTLREAGVPVEDGTVTLPEDKSVYSTYDSDGTTLVRENCTFEGEVAIGDAPRSWSATLSYDYTTANATDNLADTIRIIYIYLNA